MRRLGREKATGLIICVFLFLLLIFAAFSFKESSRVRRIRINEVCTCNFSVSCDSSGNYEDYIELVNTGDEAMSLKGYKLRVISGDRGDSWEIGDVTLAPGEYHIIFSSDKYSAESAGTEEDEDSLDFRQYIMSGRFFESPSPEGINSPLKLPKEGLSLFLLGPGGETADRVDVPELTYNTCYSRYPDRTGGFSVRSGTPEKSNDGSEAMLVRTLKEPLFSAEGGFYDGPLSLTLSADPGCTVYYTLDGSDPDEDSFIYREPLIIGNASERENVYSAIRDVSTLLIKKSKKYSFKLPEEKVDKAEIIRAAVRDSRGNWGKIRTEAYFVGLDADKYKDTAVLSLASDPEGLFGDEKGIYVLGDAGHEYHKDNPKVIYWGIANYRFKGREWEREADISFFDEAKEKVFDTKAGMRIKGNWSRCFPQKSLNIFARLIYSEEDRFPAALLPGDSRERSISLFSGGNDVDYKFLDRFAAALAEGLDFGCQEFRPVHLFLNGEYWGIMYITDKYSADQLSNRYGIAAENLALIKDNLPEGGDAAAESLYQELRYIAYSGLKDGESFERFSEVMDIESMTDYYAFEIYIGAQYDWPSRNVALWRSRLPGSAAEEDGRWRYLLFDVNHETMNPAHIDEDNIAMLIKDDAVFAAAFENSEFRRIFLDKLEEMGKSFCSPERADRISREIEDSSAFHMSLWYDRFYNGSPGEKEYHERISAIREYFRERPSKIDKLIRKYNEY